MKALAICQIDGKTCYVSTHGKTGSWAPPGGFDVITDGFGRGGDAFQRKTLPSSIPYRSLVPQSMDNLLVAGRALDADRGAYGAIRVMVNCNQMGQAAGVGAWLALDSGATVDSVDVKKLRATLRDQGAVIVGE